MLRPLGAVGPAGVAAGWAVSAAIRCDACGADRRCGCRCPADPGPTLPPGAGIRVVTRDGAGVVEPGERFIQGDDGRRFRVRLWQGEGGGWHTGNRRLWLRA